MADPAPECPLHRRTMIRLDAHNDAHYRCCKQECPVYWDPAITIFYLKMKGDWPLHESEGCPT
jgi:hypothetical protein